MDTIDEFMAFISFVIGFIYWLSNRVSKLIMERPISQIHQLIPLRSLKRVPQVKLINFIQHFFYCVAMRIFLLRCLERLI